MSTDEEKYKNLRSQLRSLPRVKARNDFESRLHKRITELEGIKPVHTVHKPAKENVFLNWLANLLRPSLVPAIGLTVVVLVAVVVYFSYYNKMNELDKQISNSQNTKNTQKGEFVIYVKKDGERVLDETNRDITSADINSSTSVTNEKSPSDVSSDGYFSLPKIQPETETHDKLDRISDEQKIEMEKESKTDSDKRSKSDDGIIMKKGYKTEEKKDAPSNYDREKTIDSGEQYQGGKNEDQNINPPPEIKQETDEENSQKDSNRISEKKKSLKKESKSDSLKVKTKKTEENDTIEK